MKRIQKPTSKHIVSVATYMFTVACSATIPLVASASTTSEAIRGGTTATGQAGNDLNSQIAIVTNLLLFIIGVIAVIAIIIGGIRYTTSNGDASQTKAAKDTILYAVVGLIVAILAWAIVKFVLDAFV